MKKGGGSESTIIIDPSKSVLVYTFHSLECDLGLARFRVFVPNYICISKRFHQTLINISKTSNRILVKLELVSK